MKRQKQLHMHFIIPEGLLKALDKKVEEEAKFTVEKVSRASIARKALVKYLDYVNNDT